MKIIITKPSVSRINNKVEYDFSELNVQQKQILLNLLEKSIGESPNGKITITFVTDYIIVTKHISDDFVKIFMESFS